MMTVEQLKMARAALGWSIQLLADKSLVSVRTIKRIESEGMIGKVTPANMKLLRETLEAAGIEFIGNAADGPGVRLWAKSILS
jgi:transcriptional regulator with XRE-family HTH domain